MLSLIHILISTAFGITLLIYILFLAGSKYVILPFTADAELTRLTVWGIRIYFSAGILIGIQMASLQTLMALGKAGTSTFLSLLRKAFLLIPFIYIFPGFIEDKVFAVILAEPVADVISVSTTIIIFSIQFKRTRCV